MKMESDLFIDFMENNTKDVIDFCNTIELKKIKDENNELNKGLIEILTNNPEQMTNTLIALLEIISYKKAEGSKNFELEAYKNLNKYLSYIYEYINDELESK